MQSNDYLSHYQNKKGIKACENMGRLSDNLFYAQEKSHKHWLLSLDNLGLRTARRGRIHNLGFRTAHRGRIHNPGLRTARRGRIYNLGLRTACGRRIHNLGLRTACGRRIQKKHPRVSPKGPSPQTTKHGDRHKRTVPVCPHHSQTIKHGDRHKRTVPVCPHKTWGQTQKDRPRVSAKGPSPCVLLLSLSLLSC